MQQHKYSEEGGVKLFACGTDGHLQQFRTVELLGGERGDMPSQILMCDVARGVSCESASDSAYSLDGIAVTPWVAVRAAWNAAGYGGGVAAGQVHL